MLCKCGLGSWPWVSLVVHKLSKSIPNSLVWRADINPIAKRKGRSSTNTILRTIQQQLNEIYFTTCAQRRCQSGLVIDVRIVVWVWACVLVSSLGSNLINLGSCKYLNKDPVEASDLHFLVRHTTMMSTLHKKACSSHQFVGHEMSHSKCLPWLDWPWIHHLSCSWR
jgi:hypothetical protein